MGTFDADDREMFLESKAAEAKKTAKMMAKVADGHKAHIKKLEAALEEAALLLTDITGTCPANLVDQNWDGCLKEHCKDEFQKCWVSYLLRDIVFPKEENNDIKSCVHEFDIITGECRECGIIHPDYRKG